MAAMYTQSDGGHFAEQGFTQDWQGHPAAGRYAGQTQSPRLSRGEVWELYRFTVTSLSENLRRRDRTHWFFVSVSFAFFATLLALLVALESPVMATMVSFAALFLGVPLCFTWRWALRSSSETHEKNLKTVRRIAEEYSLPPLPFGVDEPPLSTFGVKQSPPPKDEKHSALFSRWEAFIPNAALALFLIIFVFVWREEAITIGTWCRDVGLGVWDYLWPTQGTRVR